MLDWQAIGQWDPATLMSLYNDVEHVRQRFDDGEDDIAHGLRRFDSVGDSATALRGAAQPIRESVESVANSLQELKEVIKAAEGPVNEVKSEHIECEFSAQADHLEIAASGNVIINAAYEASYKAMQASPEPAIQAEGRLMQTAAEIAQAALQLRVTALLAKAEATDSAFETGITGAANKLETPTMVGTATNSVFSLRAENSLTPADLKARGGINDPSLDYDAGSQFLPPRVDQELSFDRKLGEKEGFPPEGVKLEPNTRYEVHQAAGQRDEMFRGYYYTDEHGTVTHVDASTTTAAGDPLNYDLRDAAPDTVYRVNNATYFTDGEGRTKATLIDDIDFTTETSGIERSVHRGITSEANANNTGGLKFDAGHIQAKSAGGVREEINYTAQNSEVNQARRGVADNYYALENRWRDHGAQGKNVDVLVKNVYDPEYQTAVNVPSDVPSTYMVEYNVDHADPVEIVMHNLGQ